MNFTIGDKVFVNDKATTDYLVGAEGLVENIENRGYGPLYKVRVINCPLMPDRVGRVLNMERHKMDWIPESNRHASQFLLNREDVAC